MFWMICAVGSKRAVGIVLLGNGSRTAAPFTFRVVDGSKISFWQTIWLFGSGPLHVPVMAAAKFPPRCSAVGTIPCVLVVTALWRNCSKLKKKNVLSWPL